MDPNSTKQSRFLRRCIFWLIYFTSLGSSVRLVNSEGLEHIYDDLAGGDGRIRNNGTSGGLQPHPQPGLRIQAGASLLMEGASSSRNKNSGRKLDPEEDPDKFKSKLNKKGDLIFGMLLLVFDFTSLLGNGCILLTFCFRRGSLSQGPVEVFLVNLAIVDILLAIFTYPVSIMASFRHEWAFGESGCRIYAFLCYFLGLACIFSVTSVALIRYMKTCQPAYGNRITKVTSYKVLAWVYLMALFWAGMPLFGFGRYGREPYGLSCTLDFVAKDRASQAYLILVTVFCVVLPLLLIIFSYGRIILLVKGSDSLLRSNGANVNKRDHMDRSETQLSWISGVITLGFIVGWGPYTVVSLWATFRGEVMLPIWATPIPVLLTKSSIAYNPIIYFFFTTRYREDLREVWRRWIYPWARGAEGGHGGRASSNRENGRSHSPPRLGPDLGGMEGGGNLPGRYPIFQLTSPEGRVQSIRDGITDSCHFTQQHQPIYHLLVIKVVIEQEDKATTLPGPVLGSSSTSSSSSTLTHKMQQV